jgi:hypothetical protein
MRTLYSSMPLEDSHLVERLVLTLLQFLRLAGQATQRVDSTLDTAHVHRDGDADHRVGARAMVVKGAPLGRAGSGGIATTTTWCSYP